MSEFRVVDSRRQFLMVDVPAHDLWLAEGSKLKASTMMVYLALIRFSRADQRKVWPSISTIEKYSGQSRKTVIEGLKALQEAKLLKIEKEPSSSGYDRSIYTLLDAPADPVENLQAPDGGLVENLHRAGGNTPPAVVENLHPNQSQENQSQGTRETGDAVKPATSEERLLARFDRFWQVYPRKVGKQAALREWKKIKPDDGMTDRMIAAVEVHKGTEQWRKDGGQYIPHPRTWLHQGRWDDVPQVELAPPTPRNRKVDTLPDFDPVAFLAREYMTMDEGQVERYRAGEPLEDVLDEHQWQHLRDELVRRGARVDMLRSAPNFV